MADGAEALWLAKGGDVMGHQMKRSLIVAGGIVWSGGCIVYDEHLVTETGAAPPAPESPTDPEIEPTAPEQEVLAWFEPAVGTLGTHTLVRLQGDVDLSTLTAIRFFGPSAVQAVSLLDDDDGWFVALAVGLPTCEGETAGVAGANDAFVEFADGTAVFLPAAFVAE